MSDPAAASSVIYDWNSHPVVRPRAPETNHPAPRSGPSASTLPPGTRPRRDRASRQATRPRRRRAAWPSLARGPTVDASQPTRTSRRSRQRRRRRDREEHERNRRRRVRCVAGHAQYASANARTRHSTRPHDGSKDRDHERDERSVAAPGERDTKTQCPTHHRAMILRGRYRRGESVLVPHSAIHASMETTAAHRALPARTIGMPIRNPRK